MDLIAKRKMIFPAVNRNPIARPEMRHFTELSQLLIIIIITDISLHINNDVPTAGLCSIELDVRLLVYGDLGMGSACCLPQGIQLEKQEPHERI